MRLHHLTMAVDLGWVALSAILAVFIRDNFVPWEQHLDAVMAYAAIAVATSALVFSDCRHPQAPLAVHVTP